MTASKSPTNSYKFTVGVYEPQLLSIFAQLATPKFNAEKLSSLLKANSKPEGGIFSKTELVQGYHQLVAAGKLAADEQILAKVRLKPTRSGSGVLPLTVLTKPFPCPGKCIFCPNDIRMPKSYLRDEPGAQRAERNSFDPYLQTYNRLLAFHNTGHDVSKVELIILGGTWTYYPEKYQIWFIKRCFDALNDFGVVDGRLNVKAVNTFAEKKDRDGEELQGSYNQRVAKLAAKSAAEQQQAKAQQASWDELLVAQDQNETAKSRCVGLVIETRPDHISTREVIRVRKLGATKTQIGFQSLQDSVLDLNHRGHDVAASKRAVALVRSGGFKIHAHWMPNLYGSNPEKDKQDYLKLFTADFQPDELKIYPCSLIESAELMDYYKQGLWRPYTEAELLDVLSFCLKNTPRYVRLTRVIRDIPSPDIVVGNKKTNFRELVERSLQAEKAVLQDIRAREIKFAEVKQRDLELKITTYAATNYEGPTTERFLEFVTKGDKICGFLRLSLPEKTSPGNSTEHFLPELAGAAIIREVHVYGTALGFHKRGNAAQHLGLGKQLIAKAKELARAAGFQKLAVISAIGTREYYKKQGFEREGLYQTAAL
jgi:elongator complex protein 3